MPRPLLCLPLLLSMVCLPALAGSGAVTASDGWAWRTRAGQYGSAGFVTLSATAPAQILAAESPRVGRIEIHESFTDSQGKPGMRRLPRLTLTAGQPLTMRHDGVHLMLIGLRTPLAAGEKLPLTLTVDTGGKRETVTSSLTVKAP